MRVSTRADDTHMHTLTRVHLASLPCRKYSGTVGHSCTHDSLATRPPPITDAECEQGIRSRFSGGVVGRSCESRSTEDPHRIRSREPSRSILARVSQPTICPDPHRRRPAARFLFLFRFGGAASLACRPSARPPRAHPEYAKVSVHREGVKTRVALGWWVGWLHVGVSHSFARYRLHLSVYGVACALTIADCCFGTGTGTMHPVLALQRFWRRTIRGETVHLFAFLPVIVLPSSCHLYAVCCVALWYGFFTHTGRPCVPILPW